MNTAKNQWCKIENKASFCGYSSNGDVFVYQTSMEFLYSRRKIKYTLFTICMDRQAWENSADPDETPHNAASHQGLHCLPLIQQFKAQHRVVNCTCSNFRTSMVRSWDIRLLRFNTVVSVYRNHGRLMFCPSILYCLDIWDRYNEPSLQRQRLHHKNMPI